MRTKLYKKSNSLLERAKKVTPLGAQTYSKSYRYFCEGNAPAFMERGEGCFLWDVDGNKFVDFICALGPITVGYNDERVNAAIEKQLKKGIIFSQEAELSIELAEELTQIIPCAEMVRFVKNGSDATAAAIRLARAYTGKDIVLAAGYHGMQDWYIASTTNNKGIPKAINELIDTFEYNNLKSLEEKFAKYKDQVACVILEPIQGDGPENNFLCEIKKLAEQNGALLIFDEVVSGFRYALGGASELYNIKPDMAAIGKGMANGMPLSAVVGRKDILELIGKEGIFVSTTFGGELLSIAAGLKTIEILKEPNTYKHIWDLGKQMKVGLEELIKEYDLADVIKVSGLEPHCGVVFEGKGKLNYLDINSLFQQQMLLNGVLSIGINNLNLSHTKKEIELYINSARLAMKDIKEAISKDTLDGILNGGKVDPIFKRNIR